MKYLNKLYLLLVWNTYRNPDRHVIGLPASSLAHLRTINYIVECALQSEKPFNILTYDTHCVAYTSEECEIAVLTLVY